VLILLVVLMVMVSPRKTAGSLTLPRTASVVDEGTVKVGESFRPNKAMALASAALTTMLEPSPVVPEAMENLVVSGSKATVMPKRAFWMADVGSTTGVTPGAEPSVAGVSGNEPSTLLMAI